MTIHYSCVARGSTIFCSHQIGSGNFEEVAENMLPNIPTRHDGKTTYTSNNYSFHCIIENGIVYMCAADPAFGKNQPYHFLAEMKRKFQSGGLASQAITARSHDMDSKFGHMMTQDMERFSKPGAGNDNISKLQSQVDDVKGVMSQNIEKVLERGERLEDLMDKTDELEAGSATFARTAKRIQRKYWWKNTKLTICLVGVGLIVLIVLIIIILFSTGVLPPKSGDATTTAAPVTSTAATGR